MNEKPILVVVTPLEIYQGARVRVDSTLALPKGRKRAISILAIKSIEVIEKIELELFEEQIIEREKLSSVILHKSSKISIPPSWYISCGLITFIDGSQIFVSLEDYERVKQQFCVYSLSSIAKGGGVKC